MLAGEKLRRRRRRPQAARGTGTLLTKAGSGEEGEEGASGEGGGWQRDRVNAGNGRPSRDVGSHSLWDPPTASK